MAEFSNYNAILVAPTRILRDIPRKVYMEKTIFRAKSLNARPL